MNKEILKLPVDLAINAGKVAMHLIFGSKEKFDYPISANITYYGSPGLEDGRKEQV